MKTKTIKIAGHNEEDLGTAEMNHVRSLIVLPPEKRKR
jgi:hypothetical protein